jgi:hypothetical protein
MIALPRHSQRVAGIVLRATNRRCNLVVVTRALATTTDKNKQPVHMAADFDNDLAEKPASGNLQFEIPQRLRQKVVCLEDAVSLVADGDTVAVCGFVAQGTYAVQILVAVVVVL